MSTTIRATNHQDFLYKAIKLVLDYGQPVSPRSMDVLEVENVLFEIEYPVQKHLFMPLRGNSPIATIAEVLWVMAGRNDMEYLTHYLPRAIDFSDDGTVWRGGYGPRLRNWNGVDQFREVIKILEKDRDSRRAVMMIFDPDRDFISSKDIPCNNQLAFTIRDEKLNVKVCSRSMDIIWGSNVNIVTWSTLQEILAGILGVQIGKLTYFVSSFHLYTHFVERAQNLLTTYEMDTPYASPQIPTITFNNFANIEELDNWLEMIMSFEARIRNNLEYELPAESNFLTNQILNMLRVRHYLIKGDLNRAKATTNEMIDTDFSRAITYYVENNRL